MRKIVPAVVAGATALAVAGGSYGYVILDKDVTLAVDGAQRDVSTFSATVGDVLKDQGITVTDRDVVAPALDTKLSEGTQIAVQYGREVKVTVDGAPQSFWTTATNVDQALQVLNINATGAELTTSRSSSIGRAGLEFGVSTLKTVTITVAGKPKTIKTTGLNVSDALTSAKITVDSDDLFTAAAAKTVAKSAKTTKAATDKAPQVKGAEKLTDGAAFVYVKVDVGTTKKTEDVAFDTVHKNSAKLDKGTTKVDTVGKKGVRTITYTQIRHDGKVISTKKKSSKITKDPVDQVVLVGTKEEPKRDTSSSSKSSSGSSKSSDNAPSVDSGSVWDRLAQCEAGGNWSINTGNGFYGGLQFTLSTWRAYGGSGMPNHASREQQIAIGKKVQAGQGWGAWPACTSKLGIR